MIRLSLFAHAKDALPKPLETTWDEFVQGLGPHAQTYPTKETLPAFSPCEFRPGLPRTARNAIRVHFGVLDCDHISAEQLNTLLSKLEGLDSLLYTTWSHPKTIQQGLWSARVCVRFSRPIEANDWRAFWVSFVTWFGLTADPQCKDINRVYFGAFVPPGTRKEDCHFIRFQGQPLDVDKLPALALTAPTSPTRTETITRERLERLALRWKKAKDEYRANLGEVLHRVCKGEPYAEPGARDTTAFQLCCDLAEAFPNGSPESIAKHFAQSLQLMGPDALTLEDIQRKIERGLEKQAEITIAKEAEEATNRKLRIRQAFAAIDPEREHPYTETELEAFSDKAKCSRDEFRKRWIIQRGPQFYLWCAGSYSAPYSDRDCWNATLRDLAPACSGGVELYTVSETGAPFRKTLPMLMADYGSVATDYVLDLRQQEAFYDNAARLFVEAPAPLRKLEPTYDQDVALWLEIMCGSALPDVLNWIALLTSLDEICAALMITGGPGTGKSLLAHGLSRLWSTDQPTDLESAMGNFNEALARCPLVFADEQLPKDLRGFARTAELRQFIAARSRPYKKKFAHESKILGAIRLMIAANNEEILAIQENLSTNDIEAIGDRFYHVRANAEAAPFLLRFCDTNRFVKGDAIAKHALWLRDNHPIQRAGRFLIKSPDREFYRSLTTRSGIRSAVCQWCIGYLKDPRRVDASGKYLARIKGGQLLVNVQAMLGEAWGFYVPNEQTPPTGRLTSALAGLSSRRTHSTIPGPKGGSLQYRVIDTESLLAWASETEFASRDEIVSALEKNTEDRTLNLTSGRSLPN